MMSASRILHEKWNEQDNMTMSKKLQKCKPRINSKTPNCFVDYRKIHKKSELEDFKDFCKRMNDLNLFRKLESIYTGKASKIK